MSSVKFQSPVPGKGSRTRIQGQIPEPVQCFKATFQSQIPRPYYRARFQGQVLGLDSNVNFQSQFQNQVQRSGSLFRCQSQVTEPGSRPVPGPGSRARFSIVGTGNLLCHFTQKMYLMSVIKHCFIL